MSKIVKNILIIMLTILSIFSLDIIVKNGQPFIRMFSGNNNIDVVLYNEAPALFGNFSGNNIVWIIIFAFLFFTIKQALEIKEKRLKKCALIIAILFSIFEVIGNCINFSLSISMFFDYWIIYTIKLIGLIVVFYSIIIVLFEKISNQKKVEDQKEFKYFTKNKKSIFIIALIIFVCWLPYFLKEFPGIIEYDSIFQIQQLTGYRELNSHHPVLHTFFVKICIDLGNLIFKSINAGVAIYTILQMIFMAIVFSLLIYYMAKRNVNFYIRLITTIYFAISPVFPIMSLRMTKDTIFSGLMLMMMIVFIEMIKNTDSFFRSRKKVVISFFIILFTMLYRNNAIYSLILTIPCIISYKKEYWLRILTFLGTSIIVLLIINVIISEGFGIKKYSEVESYAVFFQQITRVLVDNKEQLTEQEKHDIYKFFISDDSETAYKPFLYDPIKDEINKEYFKKNKIEFFTLWFKLLFKYPQSYIDAFFCLTSGYLNPEESRISIWTGIYQNNLGIENTIIYDSYLVRFIESLISSQNIPIIGLLFNCGFAFWILLILLMFNIYKKQKDEIYIFIPIILYFLTILLGPLNNEFRYMFFLFTCIPILITITFKDILVSKE